MYAQLAIAAFALLVFAVVMLNFGPFAAQMRKAREVRAQLRGLAEPIFGKYGLRQIRVPCVTSLRFEIRSEDARTERMRERGELSEIQTGDSTFDRKMYLECEDTRLEDWLRGDKDARELIVQLVGTTRALELRKGRLALTAFNLLEAGGDLGEHAQRLRALGGRVPNTTGADPVSEPQRSRLMKVRAISYLALVAGLVAGAFEVFDSALNPFPQHVALVPLLLVAALPGAALATAAYRAVMGAVRETSRGPRLAIELFVMIWVPIVGITVVAVHQFNLRMITGEEHVEETVVAGLGSKSGRRTTNYYVTLPALANGRIPATRYDSTAQINRGLSPGQPVRVYWREARLASFLLTRAPVPLATK